MDLIQLSTKEIVAELERRTETENKKSDLKLVCGTICQERNKFYLEVFKEIGSEKDLDFLTTTSLRSRFNSQRDYRFFYFKTNEFEILKAKAEENSLSFAKWVNANKAINFLSI
jgi:hypothetical protein|tara:strand:- start:10782 stop:11123 length:342 start_codon:yes stop_codon:yes gene_type:complete